MKNLIIIFSLFAGTVFASSYDSYVTGDFVKAMEQLQVELPKAKPDEVESRLKMAWDIFSQTPSMSVDEIKKIYESLEKTRVNEFLGRRIDADKKQFDLLDKASENGPTKWDELIDEVWKIKSKPLEYNHEKQSRAKVLNALLRRKRIENPQSNDWVFLMGKLDEARGWDGTKDLVDYLKNEKNPEALFMKEAKKIINDKSAKAVREAKTLPVLPVKGK